MKHKLLSILLCLAMALSLLPTAALAEGETGAGPIKVGETSYSSFSDAVNAAEPDGSGVITYEISGKVDVTATGWVQVAKAGLTGPTRSSLLVKPEMRKSASPAVLQSWLIRSTTSMSVLQT